MSDKIIEFIRQKNYKFVKELGEGACGKTVLLWDESIDKHFVCKKYSPSHGHRIDLYNNFVREIKVLYAVCHKNVVRIFGHYLYPSTCAGYLITEYVEGNNVLKFLQENPDKIDDVFVQAVDGFRYLEENGILHRDVRSENLMVREDGTVKIIDLGFGKQAKKPSDFQKSIEVSAWCAPPSEFRQAIYDFRTEVYFLGKLFEQIVHDFEVESFSYQNVLARMCERNAGLRIASFFDVQKEMQGGKFSETYFTDQEKAAYREFVGCLKKHTSKVAKGARYKDDPEKILMDLEKNYQGFMLDEEVPDACVIISCFLLGGYYLKRPGFPVEDVKNFIQLLKSSSTAKKRIVLAGVHMSLDALPRYEVPKDDDDDIPF